MDIVDQGFNRPLKHKKIVKKHTIKMNHSPGVKRIKNKK
jgi:hypothetical protein